MRERGGLHAERSAWFEASTDGVLLFSGDGRVSDANREACQVLGRPREELLGLGYDGIFDASDPRLSRALAERDRKGRFRGDLGLLRGDGSAFPAEVSLATWGGGFGVTFRDATGRDGEVREVRTLNKELERRVANRTAQLQAFVAELQESEKVLRESEERFRASFEQAAVGIAHVSLLSRWTKVNDKLCQILGYTEEELLRLGFQEVTHPEDLDTDFGRFKEALSGKLRTYSVEKRYICKGGRKIWVNQTLSVVRDASGGTAYFICVIEDVTDRKLAEETLRKSEARLKELVGQLLTAQEEERRRVAYEVHDGLIQVAISSYQHLQAFVARHPPGSSEGQEMLDRSLGLIRRTVDEARRVIAGLRPTVLDDFGLNTALRLQVEDLNEEGWQIDFSGGLGAGRLPVEVETALYRVAQEALTNVRKHSGNSTASVKLGRGDRFVWLRIEDRGKGFDAGNVLETGGPGERVGLSSMRERVELVGGEFEIRSQEGTGTTIQVRVPLPDHVETGTAGYPTLPQGRG